MSAKKTAWHPAFTGLLQERGPRWAKVTGEVQLTSEPLRVDDVIEVWADPSHDPSDTGTTLRGMWRYLVVVGLLEYKSAVWPFQHGDLSRLFAYGLLWRATRQRREQRADGSRTERLAAHEITLLLAVPSINDPLRDELDDLELELPESESGYHLVQGALLPLVVIDLGVVAEREHDDLLGAFAGREPRTMAARQWMRHNHTMRDKEASHAISPDLPGYAEYVAFMLDGLSPEDRVIGLTPEERVMGLSEAEQVLALPDAALRALSDEYIATLPLDAQQKIRARLRR